MAMLGPAPYLSGDVGEGGVGHELGGVLDGEGLRGVGAAPVEPRKIRKIPGLTSLESPSCFWVSTPKMGS